MIFPCDRKIWLTLSKHINTLHTLVRENIVPTIKMRNNFCYPLKLMFFPILRQHLLSQSWKSDNYIGSNREISNIAIVILEKNNILIRHQKFIWILVASILFSPTKYTHTHTIYPNILDQSITSPL